MPPSADELALLLKDVAACQSEVAQASLLKFAEVLCLRDDCSTAQNGQDVWIAHQLRELRGGYFVEIGADDGVRFSNTHMLEASFDWRGICVEPNPQTYDLLRNNRRCWTDPRCLWHSSGDELDFSVAEDSTLSTLTAFASGDHLAEHRHLVGQITVPSVSLNDLLREHDAPDIIDYMSIDTEGSEVEILDAFDFDRHSFRCITVEHNYTANEAVLDRLLANNGYRRVLVNFSRWDGWYVNERLDV
jgi:FkbM family methyltransferase